MTMSVNSQQLDREKFQSDNAYVAAILQQHGISRQTSINEAAGEATYVDYAGGLQDEALVSAIMNGGFGETDGWDEAEVAMRDNIANIYAQQGRSNFQTGDLCKMIRSMGYTVEWGNVKTQYIVDDKGNGSSYRTEMNTAHLTVLTITDKDGNNIVICDANGNAAIEVEELFINEIISGATSAIEGMEFSSYSTSGIGAKNAADMSAFDVNKVLELDKQNEQDIWLKIQLERAEKEEEKEKIKKEQEEKVEANKEAKAKKDAETKERIEKQKEAQEKFDKELEQTKEEYYDEFKNNEEYKDLSDKELEKMALDKAAEEIKDKLEYRELDI